MYNIITTTEGFKVIQNIKTKNEVLVMRKGNSNLLVDIETQDEIKVDGKTPLLLNNSVLKFLRKHIR